MSVVKKVVSYTEAENLRKVQGKLQAVEHTSYIFFLFPKWNRFKQNSP